jgi:hypothetical protein
MKRKAKNIAGRNLQLFIDRESIDWAIEVHTKGSGRNAALVTGVIMTGNEDCPDELWITSADDPNHIDTVYELITVNGEAT